jgi:hypothetical protein
MGERGARRVLVGRREERRLLGRLGIDGSVISKWIFRKWDAVAWNGLLWLRIGTGGRRL